MNQMRELFEKWAKSECLDTDSVDGFYSDNDTHIAWGSWQASQSAAVPVVGNGMLEKFKTWKDERIGRHALIEPLEWFAGGYACAESSHAKSVPVVGDVGDVVAWSTEDRDRCVPAHTMNTAIKDGGASLSSLSSYTTPLIVQPATSITAAELDALRRDAERYRATAVYADVLCKHCSKPTMHVGDVCYACANKTDAAIAGETNHG